MPKITKGMSLFLFILILLAGGLFYLNSRKVNEEMREIPAPVVLQKARTGHLSRSIRLTGISESRSRVTIISRISGLLEEVTVSMGDEVKAGDIIARVDDDAYRLTLAQAGAALTGAESTYRRIESLYKSNAASPQSYDEALAAYDMARSQYAMAELNLNWCDIRAPLDGSVLETHQEEGTLVSPQHPLMTIADLKHPELKLNVPERYYGRFSEYQDSMRIKIHIPALDDQEFSGRVKELAPWIAPESKTFGVHLEIDDPLQLIRPGMFATVLIDMEQLDNIAILDWECLDSEGRLWYLDEDKLPRQMKYEPSLQGEEGFQAPPGMEDVFFIVEGQHFLTEGHSLRIIEQ